jgi:predicted nucleic acid-binding Zn ribbon protein
MRPQNLTTKSSQKPRPIGGIIESVIGSLGLSESYSGWLVVSRWREIVNAPLADKARAFRYDSGVLYIAVPDASWRQNLAMDADMILEKIRSYPFGRVIKQLRFVGSEKGL